MPNTQRPMTTIANCTTGEIIVREMDDQEYETWLKQNQQQGDTNDAGLLDTPN